VYADIDGRMHEVLRLRKSVLATFFHPSTPVAISGRVFNDPLNPFKGFKPGGMDNLSKVMGVWLSEGLAIVPPEQSQAFNQGGFFVFDERVNVRLAHVDSGTGDHVKLEVVEGVLQGL